MLEPQKILHHHSLFPRAQTPSIPTYDLHKNTTLSLNIQTNANRSQIYVANMFFCLEYTLMSKDLKTSHTVAILLGERPSI